MINKIIHLEVCKAPCWNVTAPTEGIVLITLYVLQPFIYLTGWGVNTNTEDEVSSEYDNFVFPRIGHKTN